MRGLTVLCTMGLILAVGIGIGEAQVDCTTQSGNVILNCGLDTDLTYWNLAVGDTFIHSDTEGDFAPGAATVDAADVGGGVYRARIISSACISGPSPEYEAGASFSIVGGGPPGVTCTLGVLWYINGCGDISDSDEAPPFTPGPGWSRRGFSFGTVGGENPFIYLECEAGADFTVLFDDAVVGTSWIPVELQSLSVD